MHQSTSIHNPREQRWPPMLFYALLHHWIIFTPAVSLPKCAFLLLFLVTQFVCQSLSSAGSLITWSTGPELCFEHMPNKALFQEGPEASLAQIGLDRHYAIHCLVDDSNIFSCGQGIFALESCASTLHTCNGNMSHSCFLFKLSRFARQSWCSDYDAWERREWWKLRSEACGRHKQPVNHGVRGLNGPH